MQLTKFTNMYKTLTGKLARVKALVWPDIDAMIAYREPEQARRAQIRTTALDSAN